MKNGDLKDRARAMIFKDGKILAVREKDGFIGIPGGHVKYGESPRDAIIRELVEELGLTEDVLFRVVPEKGFEKTLPDHSFIFAFDLPDNVDILPSDEIQSFDFVPLPFEDSNGNVFTYPKALSEKKNSLAIKHNDKNAEAALVRSMDVISGHIGNLDGQDRGARIKEMEQEAENLRLLIDDLKASRENESIEDEELFEYVAGDDEKFKKEDAHEIVRHLEGIQHEVDEIVKKENGKISKSEFQKHVIKHIHQDHMEPKQAIDATYLELRDKSRGDESTLGGLAFDAYSELRNKVLENFVSKEGSEWVVHSESGKEMGRYKTKEEADKRLGQIEYFKHKHNDVGIQDPCSICDHAFGAHKGGSECAKCDCVGFENSEPNCECGHSYGRHGGDAEPCGVENCECSAPRIGKPVGGSFPIPSAIY